MCGRLCGWRGTPDVRSQGDGPALREAKDRTMPRAHQSRNCMLGGLAGAGVVMKGRARLLQGSQVQVLAQLDQQVVRSLKRS